MKKKAAASVCEDGVYQLRQVVQVVAEELVVVALRPQELLEL